MSAPVPLHGPDGQPWAWACGQCRRVRLTGLPVMGVLPPGLLAASTRPRAEKCCICAVCGVVVGIDRAGLQSCGPCAAESEAAARSVRAELAARVEADMEARGVYSCPACYGLHDDCTRCGGEGEVPR